MGPQRHFSRQCGTEPELGHDKTTALATQVGTGLLSQTARVLNTGHLLESSREPLKTTNDGAHQGTAQ